MGFPWNENKNARNSACPESRRWYALRCWHPVGVGNHPATLLFVYGTLMPGERRWPMLAPYAASWRTATARGRLWDTGNGYPAATFDVDASEIPGAVVVLAPDTSDEAIRLFDEIEAEGLLFRRVEITTSRGDALTYEWLGPTNGLASLDAGWKPQ